MLCGCSEEGKLQYEITLHFVNNLNLWIVKCSCGGADDPEEYTAARAKAKNHRLFHTSRKQKAIIR